MDIGNMDYIDLIVAAVFVLFGGYVALMRVKLKQIGELFLKAHEYTDDKKLDESERKDLVRRFFKIITKWEVSPPRKVKKEAKEKSS
ncbi:MAG: hypothetical protein ACOC2U_00055 [bacterium]